MWHRLQSVIFHARSQTEVCATIPRRAIMAENKDIVVRAVRRDGRGKNDARRARRNGQVPVTMYGGGGDAVSALAELRDLAAVLRSDNGRKSDFTIHGSGGEGTE